MSTAVATHEAPNYLTHETGWKSWAFTLDHKRIGVMYLIAIAALVPARAASSRCSSASSSRSRARPSWARTRTTRSSRSTARSWSSCSSSRRSRARSATSSCRIMLGAKDVAFPRLNLMSFYIYVLRRRASLLYSIITGARRHGLDVLHAVQHDDRAPRSCPRTLGVFILGFSSILTGVNFVTTIHTMRAPGLHWRRLPLFVWGHYATSVIQVLATPVLAITLLLLTMEKRVRPRHLRSQARRRPGAVPALLLVLLAPGRVHHDSARHGRRERAHRHVLAPRHLRLHVRRHELGRRSRCSASSCGVTTCSWPA